MKEIVFQYQVLENASALSSEDAQLLQKARSATSKAYAPYSQFQVGAVAMLNNGETIEGSNQENASYPVGICAERVLLSAASTLYHGVAIKTIAISYHNLKGESKNPVSPCGICRQSLLEQTIRQHQPIKLILSGMEGVVYILEDAAALLPLSFTAADMK
ncbi:MAG TPA: cytidine deaminase [Sediminibacterium sp.]|uniref:cytidine deaminase n=1 Tax=Sediminibacterium sp. TaxID=1917865 RepID=UPI0008CB51BF|nr:cytidine deaminase [Sediminibacterium sp.]OHC85593.1 MAG: cytidine deaminase [Sphingobacteriia bacterium RIFOXYC2_FULL_35_18]OHC87646.1 MAG: cytidine deaminase [Sphingobacteriia bacterium RIFOXYD2_FULL_35_12]HLD52773.1 cytidine deaminase [Sediminibacterium sp.]